MNMDLNITILLVSSFKKNLLITVQINRILELFVKKNYAKQD